MMHRLHLLLAVAILAPSLMLLGGCIGGKTDPTRFYVLTPLSGPELEKQVTAIDHSVAIGIGPVELPSYLDRPQIVTRTKGNELHLGEFDKWAEPLQRNFLRILAENLSLLIPTDRTALFPWALSTPVDYQVPVEVARFEGDAEGNIALIARWSIVGGKEKKVFLTRKSSLNERAEPRDYEATVSAMSQLLAELSREIATAIKVISEKAPKK